jgi:dUTP pyrophosphatase
VCSSDLCQNNRLPDHSIHHIPAAVQPPVRLEVKLLHPDAQIPIRKRTTDAGYDLASIETVIIPNRQARDIHTGIAVSVSEGFYFTVDGRSSLILQGIVPYRGIIDATYCNELMVCLVNISNNPYEVHKGDRIAQIILHRAYSCDFVRVHEFSPEYNIRGLKGWGSSGR